MKTWQDVQKWLEQNEPFSAETVVGLLTGYWGEDVSIDTEANPEGNIIETSVSLTFITTNPDYDPEQEDKYHGNYPTRHTSRTGKYIAPLTAPYMSFIQQAQQRALLNALFLFGANVKLEVNSDEGLGLFTPQVKLTPQAAAGVASSTAPAPTPIQAGPTCGECGNNITPYTAKSGRLMDIDDQVRMTTKQYGLQLCKNCNGKRFKKAG